MLNDAEQDLFSGQGTSTALLDGPAPALDVPVSTTTAPRSVSILGVRFTDVNQSDAIDLLEDLILHGDGLSRSIFIANAHTLNLAAADPDYRDVLNAADHVFNDGTGVRWAARLKGIRLRDNLVGTDLVPAMFRRTAGRGYSYFQIGRAHV